MKRKFIIFLLITIILVSVDKVKNAFASPVILKKPHDYAIAVDKFMKTTYKDEETETKTALLSDLDGDGENEMITFYVSNTQNYGSFQNIDYHFTVYDIINGKCVSTNFDTAPGYNIEGSDNEDIYLNKNGNIIHVVYDLGNHYNIISYKNGELFEEIIFTDQTDSGNGCAYIKDADWNIISKQEYINLYNKYQIGKKIKSFMIKNEDSRKEAQKPSNDIKEIQKLSSYSKLDDIEVRFKGKKLEFDLPIINYNNITFYPFREISEKLGAKVSWNSKEKLAVCMSDNYIVAFKIDTPYYWVNGFEFIMEPGTNSFIEDNNTYLPVRYVAEALGYKVEWNEKTRTINIY